jgi:competence protein ComEC
LNADSNEFLILAGCIVEPPVVLENRQQVLVELAPHARARVSINLREDEKPVPLRYGQQVEITAKIRVPHNYGNPGSFDYVTYLARQDIFWTASAHGPSSVNVVPGECGTRFWAVLFRARVEALCRLERFYAGDTYTTGMMEAMLLGDSSKLQKVWTDHFRRTGTYHALVISGLHVSVLAGALLFVMRVVFVPPRIAVSLAAIAGWLYALITGWQAPVVRSAGGFTLFVIARLLYRRGRLLNLLAAVAIAFLLFDPEQLYDASFQLSFLSVAAIGAIAAPLIEKTTGPLGRGLRGLGETDRDLHAEPRVAAFRIEMRLIAETLALWCRVPLSVVTSACAFTVRAVFFVYEMALVSLVIQIGLALPMIVYFHRVSFTGLSANVLIVPALSAAVPVGFFAIVTNWTAPAVVARWLLVGSQRVADWHVRWEPSWRVPDPPPWLALAFVVSLIALAFSIRARAIWRWTAAVPVVALFCCLYFQPFTVEAAGGKFEMDAIDVAQGDALLLRFPSGHIMLVDAGGFPVFGNHSKPNLDTGEDVVSPYLWSRGITHIDVIATTHSHEDHVGGMAAIIDNFHPAELWTGANNPESSVWKAVREKAITGGVKIVPMHNGDRREFGGTLIDVLAPTADYEPRVAPKNNDSLFMRVRYGSHTFLLTGDIERQIEEQLVAAGQIGKVDVLKVAHHGSRTSSTDEFVEAARPAFAIISVGADNSYGHPTAEVLDRLSAKHIEILRTDQVGLVRFESDGKRLELRTNSWDRAQAIGLLPVFGY